MTLLGRSIFQSLSQHCLPVHRGFPVSCSEPLHVKPLVQLSCNAFNAFDSKRHRAYISTSTPLAVWLWNPGAGFHETGAGRACKRGQLGQASLSLQSLARHRIFETRRFGSQMASETRSREGKESNQSPSQPSSTKIKFNDMVPCEFPDVLGSFDGPTRPYSGDAPPTLS